MGKANQVWVRILAVSIYLSAVHIAVAAPMVLLDETFGDDPILQLRASAVDDRAPDSRFSHSAQDGSLTTFYHSGLPTTKLRWPLPRTLHEHDSFSMMVSYKIVNDIHYAADNTGGLSQISFGLENSMTTGSNRTGSLDSGYASNTYDLISLDYFPTNHPDFDTVTLTPTVIASQGLNSQDAFHGFFAPFGSESVITEPLEVGILDLDTTYTVTMDHDGSTGQVTVTLSDPAGPVVINQRGLSGATGGGDGDIFTIQHDLQAEFSVDVFSLLLWADGFDTQFSNAGAHSLIANVAFKHIKVALVPEPASLGLAIGLAIILLYNRAGRQKKTCV